MDMLQKKLFLEKLDLLYKNLFVSVPSALLCATIIFIAFYRVEPSTPLLYWYFAIILMSFIRVGSSLYYIYHKNQTSFNFYVFIATTFIVAILWGLAGSLLMPTDHIIEQMIAVIVLAGVTAGAIQSLQASLIACLSYIVLTIAPLCMWIFLRNDIAYTILGFSTTTYLLFTIIISIKGNQFLDQTLRLKYENIYLANNLFISNNQLNESNQKLKTVNQTLIEKENNLRLIHDNAPIGMAIVSLDGQWVNVNNKLCELVGYSKSELENHTIQDITYQDDIEIDMSKQAKLLAGKLSSYQTEKRYVKKNGQLIWMLTNVSIVRSKDDKPLYFISQIQDINDRKQNEKIITELSHLNEMLQLCRNSLEAYPIISHAAQQIFSELSGGLAMFNKSTNSYETVTRWGNNPLLKAFFSPSDCWAFRSGSIYLVKDETTDSTCPHFESSPQGGYICFPLIVQGQIIGLLNFNATAKQSITSYQKQIINNFSEVIKISLSNIHLNEVLRDQAIRDPLTGLYNRRYLYEWLAPVLQHAVNTRHVLCVCMIDIDFFKRINDEHGHDAGDNILKKLGTILKENIRETDIACRFGGEEFLVVLNNSDINNASKQMERILNEIRMTSSITLSIGIAEVPRQGTTINEIIRKADAALYKAKESGRNKIVVA
jgi:diguanylate cyclase (GGDEF)-like protein/PAS domain S-box-containing protein